MKSLFLSLACFALGSFVAGCTPANNEVPVPPPTPSEPGENTQPEQPSTPQNGSDPALPDNDAMRRTMQMGLGWNLGNQLDAYEESPDSKDYLMPSETVWGNPKVTQQAITKVREAGFTTIRIPVTWLAKIGPAPDYTIDPAYTLQTVYDSAPNLQYF